MSASERQPIRRALISVSDKTGLLELAHALTAHGVEIWSTGGTANFLRAAKLAVIDVGSKTGFPEIMDGRIKTLHPRVHGGLLGRERVDATVMAEHGIEPIDLLVVNLYPFAQTIANPAATLDDAIENIDIGGPAMLRAAAKNHERVSVTSDPDDYPEVIFALRLGGSTLEQRRRLAAKAYAHTADYDGRIAEYLGARTKTDTEAEKFAPTLHLSMRRGEPLRYGENPHQAAALYLEQPCSPATVAGARVLQGKALSFNNLVDADAAWACVSAFDEPACVIVKHANPCGVAVAESVFDAYERAFATDPVSAFGGIIACNRILDGNTARAIVERQFVEVIIAPGYHELALAAFASKPNVRVLVCTLPSPNSGAGLDSAVRDYKRIGGGLLVQEADRSELNFSSLLVASQRQPSAQEYADLMFAWKVAMYVKSNAIVYARGGRSIGIGAGQMSRVVSAEIAAWKAHAANLVVAGSAMASDAFFPFRDGIDAAAKVGVRAVIQPGGSMRDKEVIEAADEHGMTMVFTGVRHFRH